MVYSVYAVRCSDYDQVPEKIPQLLEMMGGLARYAGPGDRVALKPNLLQAADPDRAITTHPQVVAAVGQAVSSSGAEPFLLESPTGAFPHTPAALERVYKATGMIDAAEAGKFELCYDTRIEEVSFPEGILTKHFQICSPIREADLVINLPKFKTHALTAITGAVKNLFGVIPGRAKPGYHATLTDKFLFAAMLLDLAECVSPGLSIMDAVVGMEGNGPGNGDPRPVGYLLGSEHPRALDLVAAEMMGLAREDNPYLVEAEKQGRGPIRLEEIELVGIDPGELQLPDFQLPDTTRTDTQIRSASWWQQAVFPLFRSGMTLQPLVVPEYCVACEDCVNICPTGVIDIVGEKPQYALIDDEGCIRCYCCHETCPEDAIELHKSLLYRMIRG
jgi:uncharacterized protein (DUF362 family)/Pyruvate/2-oxoacid:ferredoxin oxidoreductase delta subunit